MADNGIFSQSIHDMTCFKVFNTYNFWDAVPLNGTASTSTIAKTVNLPEEFCTRLLRHSVKKRMFAETAPGSGEFAPLLLSRTH